MSPAPLFEMRQVTFAAAGHPLVSNADWRVERGQHWAVLGVNGSGKTTLLKLAIGWLHPNICGRVTWLGDPRPDLRDFRRGVGWVTSTLSRDVPGRETVLDLVLSGARAELGLRPPIRRPATLGERDRAERLLTQAGCSHLETRSFSTLSQGEQQRILLARALMASPLLLILDEPCAGLDPGARERFLHHVQEVLRAPVAPTLVMVTHHIEEIIPEISQLLLMVDGKISASGSTASLISPSMLEKLYGWPPSEIREVGGRYWPLWSHSPASNEDASPRDGS